MKRRILPGAAPLLVAAPALLAGRIAAEGRGAGRAGLIRMR